MKKKAIIRPRIDPNLEPPSGPRTRHTGILPVQESILSPQPPQTENLKDSSFKNDGRYTLLNDLPSGYFEYSFKELWIRPFTPNEARLLHMGRVSNNLTYIISAVAACLSIPVRPLLIEDFEFCMYWLRMHSYPTKPFIITWDCDNKVPSDEEGDEEEIVCGFKNQTTVKTTNLIVDKVLDKIVLPKGLAFPTMGIYEELWSIRKKVSMLEAANLLDSEEYAEIIGDIYLTHIAQWIAEGETMEDKINILKNSPSLAYQEELEQKIKEIPEFGVSEYINVLCAKCGGEMRRRLELDYLTFFP